MQNELERITKHYEIVNFIINHSFLFSDTEFKLILTLLQRVSFSLENFYSVMSFSELRQRTGKTSSTLQYAIKTLESKGLLKKISGKENKNIAYEIRKKVFFNTEQQRVRSFNEVNVYNLEGLFKFVDFCLILSEKVSKQSLLEILHYIRKKYEKNIKPYQVILSEFFQKLLSTGFSEKEDTEEIYLLGKLENEIYLLGKSDIPNRYIRYTYLGKSDIPNKVNNQKVNNQNQITHTHTTINKKTTVEGSAMPSPEGKEIKSEDENKNQNDSYNDNNEKKTSKKGVCALVSNKELDEFIMEDLLKKEMEGKINNANAVRKSLKEEDVLMYCKRFLQLNYRIVILPNDGKLIGKYLGTQFLKSVEKFKDEGQAYVSNVKIYLLLKKSIAKKIEKHLRVKYEGDIKSDLGFEIRDYGPEWKKYFPILS